MTNEEIVKVSVDTVAVTQTVETVETINVEEVKKQMDIVEQRHQEERKNYEIEMKWLQDKLDKAAQAGVTPDGVDGEIENIVEEKQIEEPITVQ